RGRGAEVGPPRRGDGAAGGGPDRMGSMTTGRPRGGLAALCLAELGCGGLQYSSLPVAGTPISAAEGWCHTRGSAALTVGRIVSALMGPGVGRMLDAHGPRLIMGAATAIGVLALALVAIAPNLFVFFLAWVLAGFAQAGTLYPPAFAVVTRWYGAER